MAQATLPTGEVVVLTGGADFQLKVRRRAPISIFHPLTGTAPLTAAVSSVPAYFEAVPLSKLPCAVTRTERSTLACTQHDAVTGAEPAEPAQPAHRIHLALHPKMRALV